MRLILVFVLFLCLFQKTYADWFTVWHRNVKTEKLYYQGTIYGDNILDIKKRARTMYPILKENQTSHDYYIKFELCTKVWI